MALLDVLMKGDEPPPGAPSRQSVSAGRKWHPFDMRQATQFQVANIHHSTCIHAKAASTVGMGFENDKVAELLDPLCEIGFQPVLNTLAEDYYQVGGAWLEVIRAAGSGLGPLTGLHWVPASQVYVVIENEQTYDRHYEVDSREGAGTRIYAKFGDLDGLRKRMGGGARSLTFAGTNVGPDDRIAELIYVPRTSTLSRWYGMPDWLAATATIELSQMHKQHYYDFYNNRGVAEFLLWIIGEDFSKEEWQRIVDSLKGNIGDGNKSKSNAFNLKNAEARVQVDRLALGEDVSGQFAPLSDVNAQEIVSAHRVPPLLAGIQIPGKMGAVNELPNALVAFQILVVGPAQRTFQTVLGNTLGNPKLNGGLGLTKADFNLHEITAQLDIAAIDTAARMQDPANSERGQRRLAAVGAAPNGTQRGLGGAMLKNDLIEDLLNRALSIAQSKPNHTEHDAALLDAIEAARG
jgi:hypothetical protein